MIKLLVFLSVVIFSLSLNTYTWQVWNNGDCLGTPAREVTQQTSCRPMEVGYYGIRCNQTIATFVEVCSDRQCLQGCRPPTYYRIGQCYRGNEKYSSKYVKCF